MAESNDKHYKPRGNKKPPRDPEPPAGRQNGHGDGGPPEYAYGGQTFPVPAQEAGEELARIEARDGGVAPQVVVDEARPEGAVLHPAFEWDDEVAANGYRCDQARRLVRSIRVVRPDPATQRPAKLVQFISVVRPDTLKREYVTTARVMGDQELRRQALDEAQRMVLQLRRRYAHLRGLARMFDGLDAALAGFGAGDDE